MKREPVFLVLDIRRIAPEDVTRLTAQMPPLRRDKILSRRDPEERLRSLAAGLLCREALGEWGLSDESIRYDERGKPYVEGRPDCFLSLSHSGHYALCLLCTEPCAVDVQERLGVMDAVLKTGYTEAERRCCEEAEDRESAFWTLWCRKECKAKLRPYAHLRDIDSLSVDSGMVFLDFAFPGNCCAVYCSEREGVNLKLRDCTLKNMK